MRASVGAIAIYLAFISCSCTSTALAKSTAATTTTTTTTIDNNKARLRRRAQRDVIDVQIPEKNGASNVATKEDEMALFELETAQFVNRFLQQSGSGNRRKRNQDSDDESADEDAEDISEDAVEEESEEPEPEDEEDNESIAAVDDFAPDTDDTGNQNFADPAAIIAENLNIKADIKFEQAPKNEPSDCSDMSEDERADAIRKQLSEITDLEVLDNDMTPQGKAFDWITYFDNARLCPGGSDKYLLNQRYALATLYFSTNGDDWFACFMSDPNCASTSISVSDFNPSIGGAMGSSSWLSGASAGSECSWHGIRCNDDKYVQKLEIGNNGLAGVIPQEIVALEKLDVLGLEQNSLIGPIPSGFADGLYRVRLQSNALSGPLPAFPESVLTLQVEDNRLSGEITEAVANLPNLKKLNLNDNKFTGDIPAALGSVSTGVKEIRLHGNKFDGQMPAELCVLRMQNFDFKRLSVDCNEVECECCAPECPNAFNP